MHQNELAQDQPALKKTIAILITIVLWLISAVLTILCIFAVREILLWELAVILPQHDTLSRLQSANIINFAHQCILPILGVIGVVVMIFSSEYVFSHAGKPRALRSLARIIAAECVIVLPVWFLLWRP